MKKTLIAGVVLAGLAGVAAAQSSVTVYGKIDLGLGKPTGTDDNQVREGASSRLGFKAVEDLGDGLKATMRLEHGLKPDTGTQSDSSRFWNREATVGLQSAFGSLTLGRQETPSYALVQNQIDPFGGDTVAAMRDLGLGMLGGATASTRFSDSVRYEGGIGGLKFGAAVAESSSNGGTDDPAYALALAYKAGDLYLGLAWEDTAADHTQLVNLGARYDFGSVRVSGGYSQGTNNLDQDVKAGLVGVSVAVGRGQIKAAFAQDDIAGSTLRKIGLGYHHDLSKRTKLYADVAQVSGDRAPSDDRIGYDLGVQHNF